MTAASLATSGAAPMRARKLRSISRDRRWALRWSYFFLTVFAVFFLMPPVYMLITSLKTSAEISAATNPWWVFHPTLSNYVELLTSNQFLRFFCCFFHQKSHFWMRRLEINFEAVIAQRL